MNAIGRGVIGGLAGTFAMSSAMAASRLSGSMPGEVPPRKITRRIEESVGVREELSRTAFEASWVANHLAYGAAAGVAYAVADRRLDLGRPLVAGAIFGASLWAVGYAGWLPASGLYPPPDRDKPGRVAGMIAHHLIYGVATALAVRALRHLDEGQEPG